MASDTRDAATVLCSLDSVGVSFGTDRDDRRVLAMRDVDLSINADQVIGVVGESGSGKTTLARVLVGLIKPTTGAVAFPRLSAAPGDRRAEVAMIFQDPKSSLNPRLSVGAIIADPLVVHRQGNRRRRRQRVEQLLADVGLPTNGLRRRARQMSGGQLQRVAIARALSLSPKLIVADEPTSALDVSVQAQIVNLLRKLRAELRFSMVIVSHDIRVVRALADRVVVMYDGVVVEQGPAAEIYERPRHPYTLTLLASATTISEHADADAARIGRLLGLARPFADRQTTQGDCCPFASRCWQARQECLERIPAMDGGDHAVRCVAPLTDQSRQQALGVHT